MTTDVQKNTDHTFFKKTHGEDRMRTVALTIAYGLVFLLNSQRYSFKNGKKNVLQNNMIWYKGNLDFKFQT